MPELCQHRASPQKCIHCLDSESVTMQNAHFVDFIIYQQSKKQVQGQNYRFQDFHIFFHCTKFHEVKGAPMVTKEFPRIFFLSESLICILIQK